MARQKNPASHRLGQILSDLGLSILGNAVAGPKGAQAARAIGVHIRAVRAAKSGVPVAEDEVAAISNVILSRRAEIVPQLMALEAGMSSTADAATGGNFSSTNPSLIMNEIKQKLTSRKLWVAVITAMFASLAESLGLSGAIQTAIAALGGTYVIGQGIADAGSQGAIFRTVGEKLKSRKMWVTLIGVAVITLAKQIGIDIGDAAALVIAAAGGAYNVGQGIADAGVQGEGNEI